MTEDHALNLCGLDLERIHVVEQIPGVEAGIKENRPACVPPLDPDEDGKPMFGNGLWPFKHLVFHRNALDDVGTSQLQIDAIIHDDHDLDVLDRQQ